MVKNTGKSAWEHKNERGSALCFWARIVIAVIVSFVAAGSPAQPPNFRWVRQTRGNSSYGEYARHIALDSAGNCYVAGQFESTALTFANSTITNIFTLGAFVAKYDRTGNLLWVRQPLGTNSDAVGVVADTWGNCYITGEFAGYTNTIAGTTLSNASSNYYGPGSSFIIKYDANGNALWATQAGPGSWSIGAASDTNGNLYVEGAFTSPMIQFGGTIFSNGLPTNSQSYYLFLVKYDASGNVLWAQRGGPAYDSFCMATDSTGNSYIAGNSSGAVNFGGISLSNANTQLDLAKYDSNGNAVWVQQASGAVPSGLAVDEAGNSYLTGFIDSTNAQFGNIILVNTNTGWGQFIAKHDPQGNTIWAVETETPNSDDIVYGLTVDKPGNCYITGELSLPGLAFSAAVILTNNYSSYSIAGFVAKYDSTGHFCGRKNSVVYMMNTHQP